MNFTDALNQIQEHEATVLCKVGRLINEHDDGQALQTALNTPGINTATIAEALRLIGQPISNSTISRHRRGVCLCDQ